MTDEQREILNTLIRINQFGIDESGFFTGIATTTFAEVGTIVDSVQAKGGEQASAIGDSGEQFGLKGIKREVLRNYVSVTSRTSKSMRYAFPGIEEQFKMPRNRNDADILSAARAFISNGLPLKADFAAFGLADNWFNDMTTAADAFDASYGPAASAQADRAEATADLGDWVVQGMRARRVLMGIVKNVFANNVGKLAAWLQASHIERPPKPIKPITPVIPPTP